MHHTGVRMGTTKKKKHLIELPTDVFSVEKLLPKTDCKACGSFSCFVFAATVVNEPESVALCPYLETELYWLRPRFDCNECGYNSCGAFIQQVNDAKEDIFKCPYAFGNDKTTSEESPKIKNTTGYKTKKPHIVSLPANALSIAQILPGTDCKACGSEDCFALAKRISEKHTVIRLCPYVSYELYWLKPRSACEKCGYEICAYFIEAVNSGKENVYNCPYTFGKNKTVSGSVQGRHEKKAGVHMIALPASIFDIEQALPGNNCQTCGYESCFAMAAQIEQDHKSVSRCNYIQAKLYWLKPREGCGECGYDSCKDFIRLVNDGNASVHDCPYAYDSHNETAEEQATSLGTQKTKPIKKFFTVTIKDDMPAQETGLIYRGELQNANDRIEDKTISQDLQLIADSIMDIYAMLDQEPALRSKITDFCNTYMQLTLNLANKYLSIESESSSKENIKNQKQNIVQAIGKAKIAFMKFNDDLFRKSSYSIEVEIETFERILTIDGLLEKNEIKVPNRHKD